MEFCWK